MKTDSYLCVWLGLVFTFMKIFAWGSQVHLSYTLLSQLYL